MVRDKDKRHRNERCPIIFRQAYQVFDCSHVYPMRKGQKPTGSHLDSFLRDVDYSLVQATRHPFSNVHKQCKSEEVNVLSGDSEDSSKSAQDVEILSITPLLHR